MRPDLKRLIGELRKEICPQRVLDEVQRRTSVKTSPSLRLRLAASLAAGVLMLAGGLLEWRWQAGANGQPPPQLTKRATSDRTRIASQTEEALGIIGRVLTNAGIDSEKIISDRAVPPLRNGLQITKNKIIHPIDL
jgi:hypothetical protein